MLKSRFIAVRCKSVYPLISYRNRMSPSERDRLEGLRSDDDKPEKLGFFASLVPRHFVEIDSVAKMHQFKLTDFNIVTLLEKIIKRVTQMVEDNQKYIPERHKILGSNLACAHFVVARGGSVRFKGHQKWIKAEKKTYDLPRHYVSDLILEEIDTTGMILMYEGLENFTNLPGLKTLKLCNNSNVDDWFLDRLNIFRDSLEVLEIDNCPNVTENGLAVLHRLRKLKSLKLGELKGVAHKELVALMLEDYLPMCKIEGIDFDKFETFKLENKAV